MPPLPCVSDGVRHGVGPAREDEVLHIAAQAKTALESTVDAIAQGVVGKLSGGGPARATEDALE